MADPFDIFEIQSKDAVRWLGATATLAEAQATIGRYGSGAAGRYMVVDQKTGKKIRVDHLGRESSSPTAGPKKDSSNQSLGRAANL
jgi:hypothetical protein